MGGTDDDFTYFYPTCILAVIFLLFYVMVIFEYVKTLASGPELK